MSPRRHDCVDLHSAFHPGAAACRDRRFRRGRQRDRRAVDDRAGGPVRRWPARCCCASRALARSTRIRAELDAGRDPGRELAHGAMIVLAGVLLLIPGFVTDMFGLLLFIPPVRDVAWRFLKRRVVVGGSVFDRLRRLSQPRDAMTGRSISTPTTISRTPDRNRPGGSAPTTRRFRARTLDRSANICDFREAAASLCWCRRHASQRPISIRAAMRPQARDTADGQEERAG